MTQIDAYADMSCPFAHVGLRAVARRREQLGLRDVTIRIKAWPLELVNGEQLDLATIIAHVEDLRSQVAPDLFRGFRPDTVPASTLPALALADAAYRVDDEVGEAVSFALRDALFEDGLDISESDVLDQVAATHGLADADFGDKRGIHDDWHEGEARGVQGSPHFFCGQVEAFCPSLDIAGGEDGELRIRRNMEVLDRFLADCFKLD
jgi:predicted DsbA family dithiol-disulfide isomerase